MNSDISSISSEDSPGNNRELEESLGYRPVGTRNYMFSVFNRKTKYRSLLFHGAFPLHIASNFVKEFYDEYIDNGNDTNVYYMSVILDTRNVRKETDVINLIKLEPSHKISERHNNVRGTIKRMFYIYTNIYNWYLSTDDRRFLKDYRAQVGITQFKEARNKFNAIKYAIREKYKEPCKDTEIVVNSSV
tara:strand:- start:1580 stop:2146 length:567 start_codon:yes stop_codon:yes gene_type:complete